MSKVLDYRTKDILPVIANQWHLKQKGYLSKEEQIELVKFLEKFPAATLWLVTIRLGNVFVNDIYITDQIIDSFRHSKFKIVVDATGQKKVTFMPKAKPQFCSHCLRVYQFTHNVKDCYNFSRQDD